MGFTRWWRGSRTQKRMRNLMERQAPGRSRLALGWEECSGGMVSQGPTETGRTQMGCLWLKCIREP